MPQSYPVLIVVVVVVCVCRGVSGASTVLVQHAAAQQQCVGNEAEDRTSTSTAVTVIIRRQCVVHSRLLASSLTYILRHNAINILGITRAGDRRPSRPPTKPLVRADWCDSA